LKGFATLLLLIVAAFAGFTYWQVTRLQTEVAHLKGVVAQRQAHPSLGDGDAVRLIAEATEGCKRARIALEKGQTARAKRELNASLKKLSEASKLTKKGSANGDLAASWGQISGQLDKLWKQFSAQGEKKK
jgi:hypothetical protein